MADNLDEGVGGIGGLAPGGFDASYDDYSNDNPPDDGSGGYGYGYGGGYGGGGKSAEEVQAETQAAINNTVGNYAGRGRDIADQGKASLNNINQQIEANNALLKQKQRDDMQSIQWQPRQQEEQATLRALRNRMGNAAYGSGLVDLAEGLDLIDDRSDVEAIEAYKEAQRNNYQDWMQAHNDLVSDYADQAIAIQDELSKLYSQYWSTVSNINPELAEAQNILKSAKGESSEIGEGTDHYVLPGGTTGLLADDELLRMYGVIGNSGKIEGSQKAKDAWLKVNPTDLHDMLADVPQRAGVNPDAVYYIRPESAVGKALGVGKTGNAQRSTAANKGFLDNLDAYKRRV